MQSRKLDVIDMDLLRRAVDCSGCHLREFYRPFLDLYSESSMRSRTKRLAGESYLKLDRTRSSNRTLVYPSKKTRKIVERMQRPHTPAEGGEANGN